MLTPIARLGISLGFDYYYNYSKKIALSSVRPAFLLFDLKLQRTQLTPASTKTKR